MIIDGVILTKQHYDLLNVIIKVVWLKTYELVSSMECLVEAHSTILS